jgi:hypothetical protein
MYLDFLFIPGNEYEIKIFEAYAVTSKHAGNDKKER